MKKILSVACFLALCSSMTNAAQCPSWQASGNKYINYLIIQANDDVIINNIIINRGNCAYDGYDISFKEMDVNLAVSEKQKREIIAHNKWLKNTPQNFNRPLLVTKNKEKIPFDTSLAFTSGMKNKKSEYDLAREELDELSQGAFITEDYLAGKQLNFGEKVSFQIDCSANDILEVKLETNLGECVIPRNR